MPSPPIYSLDLVNIDQPLFTIEEIRKINPQRFEMEQLSAILYVNQEEHGIIGYKQVTDQEFWVRGHMPDFPLMPGVIICECAAQLAGFYARKFNLLKGDFLGFGGMDEVRFRRPVQVGDQLVLMAKLGRLKSRRAEFDFQGFVGDKMVFEGRMIGVPISKGQPAENET